MEYENVFETKGEAAVETDSAESTETLAAAAEPEPSFTPTVCPKCDADLRIVGSAYMSEPDSVKVYLIQQLQCMNPNCSNRETYEKRHLLN